MLHKQCATIRARTCFLYACNVLLASSFFCLYFHLFYVLNKTQHKWDIKKGAKLKAENKQLLETVQLAYRKHCAGDKSIGWDELDGVLFDTLCESMGDKGYQEWSNSLKGR